MKLFSSLRAQIIIFSLVLLFVSLGLAMTASFLSTRITVEKIVQEKLEITGDLKEQELKKWILSSLADVKFILLQKDLQEEIDNFFSSGDKNALRVYLQKVLAARPGFKDIMVLRVPGGKVMVSTSPNQEIVYLNQSEIFLEGRKKLITTSIYPWPLSLEPTLSIGLPVSSSIDGSVGVLVFNLNISELDTLFRLEKKLGSTGDIFLVNRFSEYITNYKEGHREFPKGLDSLGVRQSVTGTAGKGEYINHKGVRVFGNYRWIKDLKAGLIVELTSEEAKQDLRNLMFIFMLIGLTTVAVSALVAFGMTNNLTQPLRSLAEAAGRISSLDWEVNLDASRNDEIGSLSRSFTQMAGKLKNSIGELEERNSELERFTYSVSHDLKSPVITIKGFLGHLQEDLRKNDEGRIVSDISRIDKAADKMQILLNDLLEFSRAGKKNSDIHVFPMEECFHSALDSIAGFSPDNWISFEPGPWPSHLGDLNKMSEVWQNLLENSWKYRNSDVPLKVTVKLNSQNDWVEYLVQDNGIGFPPEYHNKIFGLFEKLDSKSEGSGIGLALVKRIVEQHGGKISAESAGQGAGALFRFILPIVKNTTN